MTQLAYHGRLDNGLVIVVSYCHFWMKRLTVHLGDRNTVGPLQA